jgi:hypothetical protein
MGKVSDPRAISLGAKAFDKWSKWINLAPKKK